MMTIHHKAHKKHTNEITIANVSKKKKKKNSRDNSEFWIYFIAKTEIMVLCIILYFYHLP